MNLKDIFKILIKYKLLGKKIPLCANIILSKNTQGLYKVPPSQNYDFDKIINTLKNDNIKWADVEIDETTNLSDFYNFSEKLIKNHINPILSFSPSSVIPDNLEIFSRFELFIDNMDDESGFSNCITTMQKISSYRKRFTITTNLIKKNIPKLLQYVQLAGVFKSLIYFQPVFKELIEKERYESLIPGIEEYKKGIMALIDIKKSWQSRFIRNSLSGLLHIYDWPDNFSNIQCASGKLFYYILPDGNKYNCIFKPSSYNCSGCGICGNLEMNFFFNNKYLPLIHLKSL